MTSLEYLTGKLGSAEPWVEKGGVHWLDPGELTVRELCTEMIACHARFITITAYQLPGDRRHSPGVPLGSRWPVARLFLSCSTRKLHREHLRSLRGRGLD